MKRFAWWAMIINCLFFITNLLFMIVAESPVINFVCALFSLAGAMSSYLLYVQSED